MEKRAENGVILKSSETVWLLLIKIVNQIPRTMRRAQNKAKELFVSVSLHIAPVLWILLAGFACHTLTEGEDWKEYRKEQSADQRHAVFSEGRLQILSFFSLEKR